MSTDISGGGLVGSLVEPNAVIRTMIETVTTLMKPKVTFDFRKAKDGTAAFLKGDEL